MRLIPISVSVTATDGRGLLTRAAVLTGATRIAVVGGVNVLLVIVAAVVGADCR
jgi:hypothetical protein